MASDGEKSTVREVWLARQVYSVLRNWFFLPLAAALIGAMFINRIAGRLLAPVSYKIYVIGDMDKSVAAQTIAEALAPHVCELKEFAGVPVEVVRRNDYGEPSQAKQLAQSVARQPDTLLVVGHIASSQTKEALPIYLSAHPPIPVILTTETTPNLVPVTVSAEEYRPVLRLSPTDKEQARIAARFIAKKLAADEEAADNRAPPKQNAIWVVQDVSGDTVYSGFLANDFIQEVQRRHVKVVLWSTNLSFPSAHALRELNIGWVFFAGQWPAALILIRELRSFYGARMPHIVLSDACVDQQLIDEGGSDVKDVYLTYPMRVSQFGEGYAEYGEAACKIVQTLLEGADNPPDVDRLAAKEGGWPFEFRSLLGVKRVKDARLVLRSRMQYAEDRQQAFTLHNGATVRFARRDKDGEVGARVDPDATFYIWQVTSKTAGSTNPSEEVFVDFHSTDSNP